MATFSVMLLSSKTMTRMILPSHAGAVLWGNCKDAVVDGGLKFNRLHRVYWGVNGLCPV